MCLKGRLYTKDRSGASAVEFALVAPVFIYILAAIFGYGLMFMTSISVRQLGADAARATIAGLTLEEKEQLAKEHLAKSATDYMLLEPERVSFLIESADDPQITRLQVIYSPEKHPVKVFMGVLPVTDTVFRSDQSIKENRR